MVFTIRKKKKSSQACVGRAPVPLVTTNSTASSLLNSAALLLRWQSLLAQYQSFTPDQQGAFDSLLEAQLVPSLSTLIEYAETRGIMTLKEAASLRGGQVIVDWKGPQ